MTVATLPPGLAPTLRAAAEQLIAECGEVETPVRPYPRGDRRRRCHVCHRTGKLGGHHLADGTVVDVHKGCHRRIHKAQKAARNAS